MASAEKSHFDIVLSRYTRIFNLLGESCVVSSDHHSKKSFLNRLIKYIPTMVSLIITIGLTISNMVIELQSFYSSKKISNVIYVIFFGSIISTKFVGISQMPTLEAILPRLLQQFNDLKCITESKYKINCCKFQREFIEEVATIIGLWLITFLLNAIIIHDSGFFVNFCVSTVVLMNRITMCHVHFYLALFKNLMEIFIDYLQQRATTIKSTPINDIKLEMIFTKVIHFKLYEISRAVNAIFGWIFVAIFLQEFIDLLNQIYWTFILMDCIRAYNVIRN